MWLIDDRACAAVLDGLGLSPSLHLSHFTLCPLPTPSPMVPVPGTDRHLS
eukprot:NODE_23745_length_653_cov_1.408745.p4 GENE.NODE_23745_length_653_cov_1.408745~~NODE_23745_length_653_cov_1.408745.p4  ORF type:complete len:50 (+),score=0.15 NODE_23745_length_653_cov_1.408745:362-511(+)